MSHFISFLLPWQEYHSSTSHSCFSFKTLWRCPEPLAGQRPPPGMLLPHLLPLVDRNTLCFWQMQMLQMVLGKVQMKDLIPALPHFNKILFISLVEPFFSGAFKNASLLLSPTPNSELVTFSPSLCHWKACCWSLQSAIQCMRLPAHHSGAEIIVCKNWI